MRRKAYFGMWTLFMVALLSGLGLLHWLEVYPFFYTVFFPMFCMLGIMAGMVGFFEKDKTKWPSLVGGLLSIAGLLAWIIVLILRLQQAA